MMTTPLDGIYAKLDRTKTQIDHLQRMIDGFCMYWPVGKTSKLDVERDEEVWSFTIEAPIPKDIPVAIGEVLHNIRTPLDHLACAVALKYSGSNKGVYFPFGADKKTLEDQMREKCKRLPATALDLIRKWRPYRSGNDLLWAIHDLNRSDKHAEIVPVNLSSGSNSETYLTVWSGMALVLGSRTGQHLYAVRRSPEEMAQMGSPTAMYDVPPGTQINYGTDGCTAEESLQFLTTTPGATFSTDMRPSLGIAFKRNVGASLEPVCSVLTRMASEARSVVADFEKNLF